MLARRAVLLAALLAGPPVAAQVIAEESRATPLDVVRRLVEAHLDRPLEFTVVDLQARGDFAFVQITLQRAGGAPVDLSRKFPSPFGPTSNDVLALLRREAGQWKIFEYDIGIPDVLRDEWREKRRRFVGPPA